MLVQLDTGGLSTPASSLGHHPPQQPPKLRFLEMLNKQHLIFMGNYNSKLTSYDQNFDVGKLF